MKRIVSISFVFLYLMLSVGVAKSTHYCMDRVMNVAFFTFEGGGCFDMPAEMPMSCCDDEVELLKIEEDHQSAKQEVAGKQLFEIPPILFPVEFTSLINDNDEVEETTFEDPPPLEDKPIYLLNCSYTFYG